MAAEGAAVGPALQRVEVAEYASCEQVELAIGDLIRSGAAQPRDAITIDQETTTGWLLRTPQGPEKLRWPQDLLNVRPGAPPLTLDPKLRGRFDVFVRVRAVDATGALGIDGKRDDALPMAFELALDDGSAREVVGAKGFPDNHFDTDVLAAHDWDLSARKLVLSPVGKPVYLYGFRFVPSARAAVASGRTVSRWLATDHVTIATDPARHFAFPGVARLPNGELVVVYREGTIHGVEPTGKVSLSRSTDGGRTWLPRVTALDRPGIDDRDPSVFQMSDGTLLLTSSDCLCTSADGGRTWSEARATPVFGPHGAVEDEEGHIVYGALQRGVQSELTRIGGRRVVLQADAAFRSRDQGLSWEPAGLGIYTVYLPGALDFIWYDEPFMCVVPKRFWVFAARVDLDGYARIIRSPDRGKTWQPLIRTPVWGYPQHLLPLRDGRLLMSYGYRRPPYGIRACLSADDGKTWDLDNEIILRQDGGTAADQPTKVGSTDLGYAVSVQLEGDTILTVYYFNHNGSNCFIAGTFWQLPKR